MSDAMLATVVQLEQQRNAPVSAVASLTDRVRALVHWALSSDRAAVLGDLADAGLLTSEYTGTATQLLVRAATYDALQCVSKLLDLGADANTGTTVLDNPLLAAVAMNNARSVWALLDHGHADARLNNHAAFRETIRRNYKAILEDLLVWHDEKHGEASTRALVQMLRDALPEGREHLASTFDSFVTSVYEQGPNTTPDPAEPHPLPPPPQLVSVQQQPAEVVEEMGEKEEEVVAKAETDTLSVSGKRQRKLAPGFAMCPSCSTWYNDKNQTHVCVNRQKKRRV